MKKKFAIHGIALALLLASAWLTATAKPLSSITGTVKDEHSGQISGADVTLSSTAGIRLATTTNSDGKFTFAGLSPGKYLLEVKAHGFADLVADEVLLERGVDRQLDLQLKVSAINENVVVTATGTAQQADEVAKVVSTLDSEQIEAKRVLSLTEVMRGLPGVRIQQQGSPGSLTTVRLRGQRPFDTALLLEGLRLRDASDINGSAVSLLTDLAPVALDRIEVLRGSGSSIYGTNAIGGVLNLVPTTGAGDPRFEFGFEGGSLKTFRERIQSSGGWQRFGYSFGVNRTDVRSGIDGADEYGSTAGSGRVQFNLTSSATISGIFFGTVANSRINDSPIALPAAFAGGQYPEAVAGTNFQPDFDNPDQGRRNRLLTGAVKFSHQLNQNVSYSLAYQRVSSNRRNYNGPAINPAFQAFYPFGDFEFINVNKGTTDTLDARVHVASNRQNLSTVGFEFERESLFQQSIPSFSAFNNTTDRQRTLAVFGQHQLSMLDDTLHVSVGARGQFFRLSPDDRPGFLSAIEPESSITGDGAIAYFIRSTGTKLRVHAGNGFRAPALFERFGAGTISGVGFTRFGDPTLRAEQSISVDGGIDQRLANDRVLLGVTYFYTRLQRIVRFRGFAVDPLGLGRFSGYSNDPGGLSRGVETFMEAAAWRGARFNFSYTYTNSLQSTANAGLQREWVVPRHLAGFNLNQRYRGLMFDLNVNHTGSYIAPVFEHNFPFRMAELSFAGFTKADLFASWERRLGEDVTAIFFAGAENLFDQTYFENGFRAPGILGRGGVRFRF